MKYETAKALKEAGFPEPSRDEYYAGEFKCGCNEGSDVEGEERKEVLSCGRQYVYYPTISELIEACNDCFVSLDRFGITAYGVQWVCNKDKPWRSQGDTAEEAVANLYLEVHKV